ncbi:hypothetical protein [Mycolicibacterium moriokaense]|uniref:hypothetical protein n=1 Tax=Mycolicibacterium moriokaense TaxID=39691 RepID=UPI001F23695C|nr:hypothetical protein [Mycolicibacterium moriokaense]
MVTAVTQKKPKSMFGSALSAAPMRRASCRGSPLVVWRRSAPAVAATTAASRSARLAETGTGAGAPTALVAPAADAGATPGPIDVGAGAAALGGAKGPAGGGVGGGPSGIEGAGGAPTPGAAPTGGGGGAAAGGGALGVGAGASGIRAGAGGGVGTDGCAAKGVLASWFVNGAGCGGVPVGGPPAAALAASVVGVPVPAAVGFTDGAPAAPEVGLEVDVRGELGLLMPGEPEGPPPRFGAALAGPPGAGVTGPPACCGGVIGAAGGDGGVAAA